MRAGFLDDFILRVKAEGLTLHGIAVQQDGETVAQHQWVPDEPHILHSLSKSFTAMAVGLAIDDGVLALTDQVYELFPEDCPPKISPYLEQMTIRHLLTMAAGHDTPKLLREQRVNVTDQNWARYYLSCELDRRPGDRFMYDTGCTYMLSYAVQKATGQTLLDYLTTRLFEPLGIGRPRWDTCPRGVNIGGAGLYLRTAQILPFGQMLLGEGLYKGRQLVPEVWVAEAIRRQIDTHSDRPDWDSGYGYQFWMCQNGAYRGDGAEGQLCIVAPEKRAVIAVTADEPDMQAELNAIWETIWPKL